LWVLEFLDWRISRFPDSWISYPPCPMMQCWWYFRKVCGDSAFIQRRRQLCETGGRGVAR
jgi:hypothetical protein